jgi:RNA polymerase sigma-70 factor (ECF subfamily)
LIELSDIIERCKKRDVTAQRLLYERYANLLRSICMRYITDRHEVKDIVQDSFIKILSKINQYNGAGSFEGWMSRILVNTAISHQKSKKKHAFANIDSIECNTINDESDTLNSAEIDGSVSNTYDSIEQMNFTKEELLDIIMTVPESYRVVFNMFHLEEFSHDEIAKILGIDVSNSRIRLLRARKLIREELVKKAKNQYSISRQA